MAWNVQPVTSRAGLLAQRGDIPAMQFERLGPYRIGEELGKGGMGAVYWAEHVESGEVVAVKALAPQLAMAEGFRERFEAEIESLKKLRHEGIVRLVGYGEQDGILFYAMELVEGASLEDDLGVGRRFHWREVTEIGTQVCHALKHAHDHGIIHRDIKPANLLQNAEGKIKIADFGIARLFGGTQLTSAGGVLGTADYMSPEQAEGRVVTEACDQYSLGGVMYALLAGRPPFRAKNLVEMLQMQRYADPEPVRRYAPDTPKQLDRLIMQLLSKSPNDRFRNVLVLGRHIEAMQKALSRPVHDYFALAADHQVVPDEPKAPVDEAEFSHSLAMETTRVELDAGDDAPIVAPEQGVCGMAPADSETDQAAASDDGSSQLTGMLTQRVATAFDLSLESSLDIEPLPKELEKSEAERVAKQTRFTTVEEEARKECMGDKPPWYVFIGRIVALVVVLAGIIWGFQYVTRPTTADELYDKINQAATGEKVETFYTVEEQIDEFLERFADDPRARQVAGFQEEIEDARLERRLDRIASRETGSRVLLPIEQHYVEAVRLADSRSHEAIRKLEAILAMYPTTNHGESDAETTPRRVRCLKLVERRLTRYNRREEIRADAYLPELEERLLAADALAGSQPTAAKPIYNAIIELYSDTPWAKSVVTKAKDGLKRIED